MIKINNDMLEKITLSKQSGVQNIFRNAFKEVPTWDDIFDHLNDVYINFPQPEPSESYRAFGGIKMLDPLYIWLEDAYKLKHYDKVLKYLSQLLNKETVGGIVLLDLMSDYRRDAAHFDNCDVFHWQMIGKTKWLFGKVENFKFVEEPEEHILYPGDLVFIPQGLGHHVTSLTPRSGATLHFHV